MGIIIMRIFINVLAAGYASAALRNRNGLIKKPYVPVETIETVEVTWNNEDRYWLSPEGDKRTFVEARRACIAMGRELAEPNTLEENKRIRDFMPPTGGWEWTWIGITDVFKEGSWTLLDGTPLTYTNWNQYQPEPNGRSHENCATMHEKEDTWIDESCHSSSHRYICGPVKSANKDKELEQLRLENKRLK